MIVAAYNTIAISKNTTTEQPPTKHTTLSHNGVAGRRSSSGSGYQSAAFMSATSAYTTLPASQSTAPQHWNVPTWPSHPYG